MTIVLYANYNILPDLDRGAAGSARLTKYPELKEDVAIMIDTKEWHITWEPRGGSKNNTPWESAIIYKY